MRVGRPTPRWIEVDHAGERREPAVVARDVRLFVERVDREDEADEVQEVDGAVSRWCRRRCDARRARVPDASPSGLQSRNRFAITMRWIWFVPS